MVDLVPVGLEELGATVGWAGVAAVRLGVEGRLEMTRVYKGRANLSSHSNAAADAATAAGISPILQSPLYNVSRRCMAVSDVHSLDRGGIAGYFSAG